MIEGAAGILQWRTPPACRLRIGDGRIPRPQAQGPHRDGMAMTDSPQETPTGTPDSSRRLWLAIGALFIAMAAYAWAVDFISVQGERTVYTVDCVGGVWSGAQCSGNLVAGERYRFRAL